MYAPSTPQLGSSVSHWDTVLSPNQLMEPSYTQAIHEPGLEIPLFQDIGWTIGQRSEPGIDVSPTSMNYATVQAGRCARA